MKAKASKKLKELLAELIELWQDAKSVSDYQRHAVAVNNKWKVYAEQNGKDQNALVVFLINELDDFASICPRKIFK